MKRATHTIMVAIAIAGIFLGGSWYGQHLVLNQSHDRSILYYTDPMHPAYKSDRPGIAPDCGMELVPVYADRHARAVTESLPAGVVSVSAAQQQLIGVRLAEAETASATYTLRLFGRVAPDETRLFKLNAGVEGSIRQVSPVTTGSSVRKGELLATFAAPEFVTATQAYLVALAAMDRLKHSGSGAEIASQIDTSTGNPTNTNFQERLQKLENMGMSSAQLQEIRRTRKIPESIRIVAPANGFVLARNVTEGQKFDRGAELYRIADLKRVWILAEVAAGDAQHLRPGMRADVLLPDENQSIPARVSDILPQPDPGSPRLRLRLDAENPGYLLRPDMFVDVRVSITSRPTMTVPADAVLDSGLTKRVFVARGEGTFEPREVEIGRRFDDRVQVLSGLAPGERVVVAGNFLLDSESRLKRGAGEPGISEGHEPHSASAAAGVEAPAAGATDPACGMRIDPKKAMAAGRALPYRGTMYYFCSDSCKQKFDRDAAGILRGTSAPVSERKSSAGNAADHSAAHAGLQG